MTETAAVDTIFISFSKRFTSQVGRVLYDALTALYSDKPQVDIFHSAVSLGAGNFAVQIREKLRQTKVAISVLSPENIKGSPWLMYEAGGSALAAEINGGQLIPYLFCRHRSAVEDPIRSLNNYQYQLGAPENQQQLRELFLQVNRILRVENRLDSSELQSRVTGLWKSGIADRLAKIAKDLYDPSASAIEFSLDSRSNVIVDPAIMTTVQQGVAVLPDDFAAKTPRDLEAQFANVLNFYIPSDWKVQNETDLSYDATRVIINGTRISTFVSFTDGQNILLLDRSKSSAVTNVINQRYDVFGSVQFENRSIKKKINSATFLDAPIKAIQPLYGAAFESNQARANDDVETAVMFGVSVLMLPEALLAAKESTGATLLIFPIEKAKMIAPESLTSKARLAIAQTPLRAV